MGFYPKFFFSACKRVKKSTDQRETTFESRGQLEMSSPVASGDFFSKVLSMDQEALVGDARSPLRFHSRR